MKVNVKSTGKTIYQGAVQAPGWEQWRGNVL